MTISNTPRKSGPLLGNSSQTAWPFAFKVFSATDIKVTVANAAGVETVLTYGTDYSVAINSNQDTSPGGAITYPLTGDPLPSGSKLTIVGNLPYDQPLDLPSGGNFSPLAVENQFDRAGMQIQQLAEQAGRAFRLPVSASTSVTPVFPIPEANRFIAWNPTATGLTNADIGDLASQIIYADWLYETFTGDGSRTLFALMRDPASIANLDLSVDGVTLVPGADFTTFGNTISFTTAPALGAEILVRYGRTVSQRQIYQSVYRVDATAGQTAFTIPAYLANQNALSVYVNGLRMEGGSIDYVETDTTTVTFTSPLTAGDSVVFIMGLESFDGASGGTGGGGGTDADLGGTTLANFSMSASTPSGRVPFVNTTPNGWNTKASRKTLDFEWVSNGYFAANPDGHVAVVTRCDTNLIASAVFGAGLAIGDLTGAPEGPANEPCAVLETWANGVMPGDNRLIPGTSTARNKPLQDGVQYRSIIESTLADTGTRYLRHRLYRYNAPKLAWDLEHDTGDVLDSNTFYDTSKEGVVFAHVFASNLSAWSIDFSNIKVTWSNPRGTATEQRDRMSKYGAELDGDLLFVGNGRRVLITGTDNIPANFPNWVRFQSRETGKNTTVLATPPSGSSNANFLASNTDNLTVSKTISMGMVGTDGVISTFDLSGSGDPPLQVKVGGTLKATFNTGSLDLDTSLKFTGNARRILINDAGATYANWTTVQSSQANGTTALMVAPSGVATTSTVYMSNSAGLSNFGTVGLGMNASEARLESFGVGGAPVPPIRVNVGAGNEVARFTASGITVLGAGRAVGAGFENFAAWYNIGGTTARNFTNSSAFDLESVCTFGTLTSFMSPTPTNGQVENVLRPLYCGFSALLRELMVRKVINA